MNKALKTGLQAHSTSAGTQIPTALKNAESDSALAIVIAVGLPAISTCSFGGQSRQQSAKPL